MKASLGPSASPCFRRALRQRGRPGGGSRRGPASSMTPPRRFLGIWLEAARHLLTTRGGPRCSGPSPNADRRERRQRARRTSRRGSGSTPRAAVLREHPCIRALSARRCTEPRLSSPVPEPFFSRRQQTARVGKQKPPRSDPRGLRRFSPELRAFRALRVLRRCSRACSQRAPSELDERRVGQLSRSLSCPVGREKPRGV